MNQSPAELNQQRKREEAAKRWKFNPAMERLRQIKQDTPDRFDAVDAGTKLSFGYYEADRAEANAAGRDVSA